MSLSRPPLAFLSFLIGALATVQVHAQAIPTPGAVQEQLRPRATVPSTPSGTVQSPPAPSAAAGVPAGGPQVQVQRFEITGNSSIPTETLHAVVAPYEGKAMTLLEIYDVADLVTRHYRTAGYTLASAFVPEQEVSSGVIRLEVIEGRLGEVRVEGAKRLRPGFVRWQLNELKTGEVVRDAPLTKEALLLNDLPGVEAQAVLLPGSAFGSSDLVVKARERWLDGSVGYDNYGRESIGEERLTGQLGLNGLLGVGDRLDVSAVYAEADLLHYGRLAYSVPVSPWGTTAQVYYSSYDYAVDSKKLGPGFSVLDIDGEGDNFGVNFQHPVWRSARKNLFVGLGYDRTVTFQEETTFGSEFKQHIGVAALSALFDYVGTDRSYSTASASLRTNFQGNERDTVLRTLDNNAQAARLQLDLSHWRPVWRELSALLRFSGVLTPDPLLDTEQFRLGGPASVRAYPSSELAGDEGFFASLELQHPVRMFPGLSGQVVKAFVDTGRVYRKNHNLLGVEASESLSGVGLGYQAVAFGRATVDATLAYPLGQHESSDDDDGLRFWTGVTVNF
jgi:hemolysin activation/secretion protein